MTWQPLSRRSKGLEPDGPFEGVPPHLSAQVAGWLQSTLGMRGYEGAVPYIGLLVRFEATPGSSSDWLIRDMVKRALIDEEFCLDLVDATLRIMAKTGKGEDLKFILDVAGSVWTVSDEQDALVRAVADELSQTLEGAVSQADSVSDELRKAWTNAYGRNGDPSDAWDHAIKALEAALIPAVVPKKAKPNLGDVLGLLRANDGNKWRSTFPGKDDDNPVDQMVKTLEQIWPNIVRHQGVQPSRQPTEAEARSVVALTAALIQAHRESPLVYKV